MDQAGRIMLLKIKTDKILHHQSHLTDDEKNRVILHTRHLITSLAPERVWLFLKISRNMGKFHSNDFTIQIADLELDDIEDKFAKCKFAIKHYIINA